MQFYISSSLLGIPQRGFGDQLHQISKLIRAKSVVAGNDPVVIFEVIANPMPKPTNFPIKNCIGEQILYPRLMLKKYFNIDFCIYDYDRQVWFYINDKIRHQPDTVDDPIFWGDYIVSLDDHFNSSGVDNYNQIENLLDYIQKKLSEFDMTRQDFYFFCENLELPNMDTASLGETLKSKTTLFTSTEGQGLTLAEWPMPKNLLSLQNLKNSVANAGETNYFNNLVEIYKEMQVLINSLMKYSFDDNTLGVLSNNFKEDNQIGYFDRTAKTHKKVPQIFNLLQSSELIVGGEGGIFHLSLYMDKPYLLIIPDDWLTLPEHICLQGMNFLFENHWHTKNLYITIESDIVKNYDVIIDMTLDRIRKTKLLDTTPVEVISTGGKYYNNQEKIKNLLESILS